MEIECVINTAVGTWFYKYIIFITRVNLLKMEYLLKNDIVHTMLVAAEYPLCLNTDFHLFRIFINKKKNMNDIMFSDSAVRTGLEPVTPCVTGMYSNQLN